MSLALRFASLAIAAVLSLSVIETAQASVLPDNTPTRGGLTHPLVGKAMDVRTGQQFPFEDLAAKLSNADIVLFGERHDNIDQHVSAQRLMAETASLSPVTIVLEMIDEDQEATLNAWLRANAAEPDDFGADLDEALQWTKRGWPDFDVHVRGFNLARQNGWRVVAGNLPVAEIRGIVKDGLSALPTQRRHSLGLDIALPSAMDEDLRNELRSTHCGHLPEEMIPGMIAAQRVRDGVMTRALIDASRSGKAFLLAGAGHTRTDRGVPWVIANLAPGKRVLSVGFMEVPRDGDPLPDLLNAPYDFLVFTPYPLHRPDPCEAFRKPPSDSTGTRSPK